MPWQLPQEDVLTAWSLVERRTLQWETRQSGGVKVALDEVRWGTLAIMRDQGCSRWGKAGVHWQSGGIKVALDEV